MKTSMKAAQVWGLLGLALYVSGARAAEDFQVRYNIAGSLGGEIFSPPEQVGFAAGVAATYIDIEKITGGDGKRITKLAPGGSVSLPAPLPSGLSPSYPAQKIELDARGTLRLWNLAFAYATEDRYAGGRLVGLLNIPYGIKKQTVVPQAGTPTLNWNAAVPASIQSAVNAGFERSYQSALAASSAAQNGDVSGLGDIEVQGGWLYTDERWRVLAGASLVMPTGRYSEGPSPDIGAGNFYTLRPSVQLGYLVTPEIALAGKMTVGLNTRNRDNDLRSGNWLGFEGAAAYKTAIGVIGLHAVRVQQYQDDSNNPWGAARLRSTTAGAFFTTVVPGIDAALTLQFVRTLDSKYAKSGTFTQLRLIKAF